MNDDAGEWRRRLENHYYHENIKLFQAQPWRASYWTIMKDIKFDELRHDARSANEGRVQWLEAYLKGELPEICYTKGRASREEIRDSQENQEMLRWIEENRREIALFLHEQEKGQ